MSLTPREVATKSAFSPRRTSEAAHHLWAFLGYFALALMVTYPLILHVTTQVPGDLLADRNQHLWDLWWIREALFTPTNPFHTDMLYHPYGVDLYYHALGLSHGLLGLVPYLLWGLPAGYNAIVLAAFTLSGYGAYRLCLLFTHNRFACFLGGVVFAFTPYMLDALKGQTEVLSVQWIPFYAEAWIRTGQEGKKRYMLLAGALLAVTAYGSLYYAVYLLLFTALHILYSILVAPDRAVALRKVVTQGAIMAVTGLLLMLPLVAGLAANYNNPRLEVPAGQTHMLGHSADLLSLFSLPGDHPLVTALAGPRNETGIPPRDYITLGYVALAMAATGAVVAWRRHETRFWVALGSIALLLALGPQLQIGDTVTTIPMPFKLVEGLPGVDAIGKVLRFTVLTRLAMGVLAAWGAAWAISKLATRFETNLKSSVVARSLPFTALLLLLLVELPLHPRFMQPLVIPPGFSILAQQDDNSGLLEIPFARRQVNPLGESMLYQTVHGRPIMGGYLSRPYTAPTTDSCSPFWGFISPIDVAEQVEDITTSPLASRLLDVLDFYRIGYVAVYNRYGGAEAEPLSEVQKSAIGTILAQVSNSAPMSSDDTMSLYKVAQPNQTGDKSAFYIGANWHGPEQIGGVPFRWMKERTSTLCVWTPRNLTAALVMEGTAYAHARQVELSLGSEGGTQIYSGMMPVADFAQVRTEPIEWSPGVTEIHIKTLEPATSPKSLDPNVEDDRLLRVGFTRARLEPGR